MTITDTMKKVWKHLISAGLTPEGAAGVMGNLYAESGVIPNRVEILCLQRLREIGKHYTDATYTALVDDGGISRDLFLHPLGDTRQYGYGLAQWTSPGRKGALYDLCRSRKVSIGDLTTQLDYLMIELCGSYKAVLDVLTTTKDVRTASDKVLMDFEQPAQPDKNTRYQYSMEIYNQLATSPAQKALDWMLKLAADPTAGYSQQDRWGPNFDCSSSIISAFEAAGIPVKSRGATFTGNMRSVFLACGFKDVTSSCNLSNGSGMVPGDVLLNEFGKGTSGNGHAAMYAGNGQIVHARGQSYGSSKTGDQGSEIAVTADKNHPFELELRYGDAIAPAPNPYIVGECSVTLPLLLQGAVCNEVKTIQAILNAKGYKSLSGKVLTVDGELGENTAYAISNFQKKMGMKDINFGSVAKKTWELLLK